MLPTASLRTNFPRLRIKELRLSVVFKASEDTYMTASTRGSWELLDEEKIRVAAGDKIVASLLAETDSHYYVELAEHVPGNWRKLWYLLREDWEFAVNSKARGHVDIFKESSIAGWVYYVGRSDTPVALDFYFDKKLVGTAVADRLRADVKRAGLETDRCGFLFTPPPGTFAQCETIEVRTSNGQTIGKFTHDVLSGEAVGDAR